MDSTSVSLLHRLKKSNEHAAWQRFVELYAPLIFHWGLGRGLNRTDVADLVQEVLAVLVNKLPEFEYDKNQRFRGWLRTITVNKANDFHRRNAVRTQNSADESVDRVATADEVDLFVESEYRSFLVNRTMELMRSEFRDSDWKACWQQVVEGKKASEVAADLGISVNTAYLAKSRVLGRLRQELDGLMD